MFQDDTLSTIPGEVNPMEEQPGEKEDSKTDNWFYRPVNHDGYIGAKKEEDDDAE